MSETELLSKAAFAARINVSPGRISQMIRDGKISPDALDGCGRFAKIIVPKALKDLSLALDPGQMAGNGLGTTLTPFSEPPRKPSGRDLFEDGEGAAPNISYQAALQAEKLEQSKILTRKMLAEEKAAAGKYMLTSDVQATMSRMATNYVMMFDSVIPDIAIKIAGQFQLSHREVTHVLKEAFREAKTTLYEEKEKHRATVPKLINDESSQS